MIKNSHNTARSWRSVLASLLMLVSATVMADEVSINSITVDKGETVTVDVNFDMTNNVVGLQMFIDLPYGIDFAGGVTRNAERIDRDTHDFQYNLDGKTLKVVILPVNGDDAIEGASGKLFSFDVKATEDVYGHMNINNIMESTIADGKLKSVELGDARATIASTAWTCNLDVAEAMTIKEGEANKQKVTVNLVNGFDVAGMQFTVTLPQGLTPETNSKGRIVFSYGDRLPEDFSIRSNTTENGDVKVVVSNMTGEKITNKKSGEEILSFNVIADNTLAESSEIVFSKGAVSTADAESRDLDDCRVKVTNQTAVDRRVNDTAYGVLDPQLKSVQDKFDAAVNTIATYTTTDAQTLATGKEATEIDSLLKAYRTELDEANKALAVKNADSIAAAYTALDGRVDALLAAAEAAETTALKANADTYTALDAQLKAVQEKYTSVVEALAAYKTEEAKAYANGADVADIDSLLKVCRAELDAAYEALALRSVDSLAAVYMALDTRITALASAAETAEATALKANADCYKILDAQLKAVQTRYNSALAIIGTYTTPEGKAYMSNAEAAEIDSLLNAYRTTLDEANDSLSLRSTETVLADYTTLDAKIVALSSAASVAESAALKTNASVYEAVTAKISEAEVQFEALINIIKTYTTDEAKALADGEEAQAIAQMLADLKQSVDDAKAAYTLKDADAYDGQLDEIAQAMEALGKLAADTEEENLVTPGDVNGDGEIDITDVSATIGYILEENPEGFNSKAADVNGDGIIDITDVTLIINRILSLIK